MIDCLCIHSISRVHFISRPINHRHARLRKTYPAFVLDITLKPSSAMSLEQASSSGRKEAQWDFLKGSGPSSALYYYAPLSKEGAFKPGWNTKRPQAVILQDAERKSYDVLKEHRSANFMELRKERIVQSDGKNRFNPISHQTSAPDGSWIPTLDPWQHQRVGIRAQEPRIAAVESLKVQADTTRRNIGITELRKERIANGGLSQHPGGTMKEVLTWAGR